MNARAVPFYCPFCGEQDIRPDDAGERAWRCESCDRRFELTAMSVRAVPFYCPFCGEQDIRPDDAASSAWRCESCERGFELTAMSVGGER